MLWWLDEEMGTPDRTAYYLMQMTAVLQQIPGAVWGIEQESVSWDKLKIPFKRQTSTAVNDQRGTIATMTTFDNSPEPSLDDFKSQQAAAWSMARWSMEGRRAEEAPPDEVQEICVMVDDGGNVIDGQEGAAE